ncbi:hypothetical protein K443DRAFT_684102 [Laccaria amethystina LaAM-08-1]|uniref:Uncharacterized protein n=1 Tax=Laccaria amethystina LaAM-08-1 TaxID=1095629 RepID=A0A0C9WJ31_9AGAR|nr:hypothetical protein K443DRAFT_684102 [Laccaria amethystina LaAM-08-1]
MPPLEKKEGGTRSPSHPWFKLLTPQHPTQVVTKMQTFAASGSRGTLVVSDVKY